MRKTDGTSLPCSVHGDLGDRRDGNISDGGAVLLLFPRLSHERCSSGTGSESSRERREAVAHITYFVAMPFNRNEDGELVAGEAQDRQSAGAAENAARRMAEAAAGAVAFSRTGDPSTGEFEDAVVLRQFGEVPSLDALLRGE